jgi:hypothetical protein
MTMKSKSQILVWGALLCLAASTTMALAQTPAPANAAATLRPPINANQANASIDPSTGLPTTPSEPEWIDPNWSDPALVLTNVVYDGMPLGVVADHLRETFQKDFDILPMPTTYDKDWGAEVLSKLNLRHVKASEVFNAMNLVFENDHTPVRWELKSNPHGRPLVQLRVLPEAAPEKTSAAKPSETQRMVFFIGNLVGDEKAGGMTMDQIIKTITDLWPAEFGKPDGVIQFHKEAQLLVINGTGEEISFVHQTLAALQQKIEAAQPKTSEDKDLEQLNKLIKSLKNIGQDTK